MNCNLNGCAGTPMESRNEGKLYVCPKCYAQVGGMALGMMIKANVPLAVEVGAGITEDKFVVCSKCYEKLPLARKGDACSCGGKMVIPLSLPGF